MMTVATNALMKKTEKLLSTHLKHIELPVDLPLDRISEAVVFKDYS